MALADLLTTTKRVLQGKPFLSHPVHVILVHFPMTLVPVGFIFDTMASQDRKFRSLQEAGYYANLFGIVTTIPTAVTGLAEWWDIPRDHPAWLTATTHAALNDIVLGIGVYNWWSRRNRRNFQPNQTNLVLGGVATVVLSLSGWLGGLLSYDHGLGVQRQGAALEVKREDEEWEQSHGRSKPASEEDEQRAFGVVAVPEGGEQTLGADI
ncbi:MAG: DUF2231 domain-containing protein [Herpetosiphonaceae bacterium]|nr:DUF2231 domain-containing protein [Herpetosiphonaceae bacterium]